MQNALPSFSLLWPVYYCPRGQSWVCGGQCNMEFPMNRAFEATNDIAGCENPMLRLFLVSKAKANTPAEDVKGQWKESSPQSVGGFSAVGWYFGRDLQKARQV